MAERQVWPLALLLGLGPTNAQDKTSFYAQWWGWRRIKETLRQKYPDIVIDGRQLDMLYGPWIWLSGSYPHP
ncbi:hypothetical protein LCGC14_1796390, partial [marine sediment metagenome]